MSTQMHFVFCAAVAVPVCLCQRASAHTIPLFDKMQCQRLIKNKSQASAAYFPSFQLIVFYINSAAIEETKVSVQHPESLNVSFLVTLTTNASLSVEKGCQLLTVQNLPFCEACLVTAAVPWENNH